MLVFVFLYQFKTDAMKKTVTLFFVFLSFFLNAQESYERTWATYFGGQGTSVVGSTTDDFDNLIVVASILGNNTTILQDVTYYNQFKTIDGSPYTAPSGTNSYQSIIAKFSPTGTLLKASYLPFEAISIKIGKLNKIIITGSSVNNNTLGTPGTWIPNTQPNATIGIIAQLNDDLNINWLTYLPAGTSNCNFEVDDNNNIFGSFNTSVSSSITTLNTFQPNFITEYDINNNLIPNGFVFKLNNHGQLQWATYNGLLDNGDIVLNNNELIINATRSDNLPQYNSLYCTQVNCELQNTTQVVSKFDCVTGQRTWSKYMLENEFAAAQMTTDGVNIYILSTIANNIVTSQNAYQPTHGGIIDLYLAKFDANFQRQWGTFIGGNTQEDLGVALYSTFFYKNNALYLAGYTDSSTNFITCPTPFSATKQGGSDNFIMKFSDTGSLLWGSYYGGLNDEYPEVSISSSINDSFYISGTTLSTQGMSTVGCHQPNMNIHPLGFGFNNINSYIAKFSPVVLSSDSFAENTIQIYPNPSNGIVTISGGNLSKEKHQLAIYNELGQQVYNKNMALFNEYTINLSHLSKGVYFITLQSEESNLKQSEKLIIK